ncbi:flagellar motor switch protein FliN [Desulfotomaculum nigrificans CO-1-SRB]|uniref:Flagellar motor switch protein FliN n=1 Tax=Desulfotomaculum nigrificans (strain DSM 14880 / VKM B-2319 / CO-1-SRB) TaxID=868595 RepID=F6B7Z8_DESCC|nr:flagellar motor switch protein FliN [Desulfotomaculum nigrificans]AEF94635.1 flagellar motor switch protein FliN [Desulfotomaculum nigrificans CO-1-SRB]
MMTEKEIENFLSELGDGVNKGEATVKKVRFPPLDSFRPERTISTSLSHLADVQITISAELGETTLKLREVLNLDVGSVIDLNKSAGDAINIYFNDRKAAKGEVIVVNDSFAVRINSIIPPKTIKRGKHDGQ